MKLARVTIGLGSNLGDRAQALEEAVTRLSQRAVIDVCASDIVESILKPSLQELTHLGVIVVIRTVISFSLNWELSQERKHARERSGREQHGPGEGRSCLPVLDVPQRRGDRLRLGEGRGECQHRHASQQAEPAPGGEGRMGRDHRGRYTMQWAGLRIAEVNVM